MKKNDVIKFRVTEELKRNISELAESKGLSISGLIRMLVLEYKEKNK